jgi:threonine/homoserine/homoserine lactone efflux protein
MNWSAYGAFLLFAAGLVLIPGPDFAVVTKNTLAGGRRRGRFTALGVCTSNALQGTVAVSGLSAIVMHAQPVFQAIKWAGVCYLAVLGIQALVSAVRGPSGLAWRGRAERGRVRRVAAGISVQYRRLNGMHNRRSAGRR